eukprot:1769418-Amphidinium_carterae.1
MLQNMLMLRRRGLVKQVQVERWRLLTVDWLVEGRQPRSAEALRKSPWQVLHILRKIYCGNLLSLQNTRHIAMSQQQVQNGAIMVKGSAVLPLNVRMLIVVCPFISRRRACSNVMERAPQIAQNCILVLSLADR